MILMAAPSSPSDLTATCVDGGTAPICEAEHVNFTGTGYPHNFDVEIDGVLDPLGFTAPRGNVNFTWPFSYDAVTPANNYHTVRILQAKGKDAGAELKSATVEIIPFTP